jgi:regulatory protein
VEERILAKAKNAAYRLLKYRVRSEHEMSARLKLKKFPDEVIEAVLRGLSESGLIDDREFARAWTKDRLARGFGFMRIILELRQKGIDKDTIDETVSLARKESSLTEIIKQVAESRARRYKDQDAYKARAKLFNFLYSRGFTRDEIARALEYTEDES